MVKKRLFHITKIVRDTAVAGMFIQDQNQGKAKEIVLMCVSTKPKIKQLGGFEERKILGDRKWRRLHNLMNGKSVLNGLIKRHKFI